MVKGIQQLFFNILKIIPKRKMERAIFKKLYMNMKEQTW